MPKVKSEKKKKAPPKEVRKKTRETKTYNVSDVEGALQALKEGMSLGMAAKAFNIPKTTLQYKYTGKSPLVTKKGPASILTAEEEGQLVQWVRKLTGKGCPVTKEMVLDSVELIVNVIDKRKTMFANGRPGRHWFQAFLRRNPEITDLIHENATPSRIKPNEKILRGWFSKVLSLLQEKSLEELPPTRVFNCTEVAFILNTDNRIPKLKTGLLSPQQLEKGRVNALLMSDAEGTMLPPMVIHGYKRTPPSILNSIPEGWAMENSSKGWLDARTFYEYLKKVFHPWLLANDVELPVVLFVDGHLSHVTFSLSEYCDNFGIELVLLYPNSSHVLQPLDFAYIPALRVQWQDSVQRHRDRVNCKALKKEDFGVILKDAIESLDNEEIMTGGFQTSGLYPVNPDAPSYTRMAVKKRKRVPKPDSASGVAAISPEEALQFLQIFEKSIPKDKLGAFHQNEAEEVWTGEERDKGLFEYWLELRRKTGVKVEKIDESCIEIHEAVTFETADGMDIIDDLSMGSDDGQTRYILIREADEDTKEWFFREKVLLTN